MQLTCFPFHETLSSDFVVVITQPRIPSHEIGRRLGTEKLTNFMRHGKEFTCDTDVKSNIQNINCSTDSKATQLVK